MPLDCHFGECVYTDTQEHADAGAQAVKITYKDIKPPILSIKQAIETSSFHPVPPFLGDVNTGDVQGMCATTVLITI